MASSTRLKCTMLSIFVIYVTCTIVGFGHMCIGTTNFFARQFFLYKHTMLDSCYLQVAIGSMKLIEAVFPYLDHALLSFNIGPVLSS